jgi:hypothetical protein
VSEVETLLKEREVRSNPPFDVMRVVVLTFFFFTLQKFSELIYLYNGKKMHAQALDLLHQCVFIPATPLQFSINITMSQLSFSLSQNETDIREKLQPTVTYLQKLGEEYMDQVFKSARWVFQQDQNIAFEVRSMRWSYPKTT